MPPWLHHPLPLNRPAATAQCQNNFFDKWQFLEQQKRLNSRGIDRGCALIVTNRLKCTVVLVRADIALTSNILQKTLDGASDKDPLILGYHSVSRWYTRICGLMNRHQLLITSCLYPLYLILESHL